MKNPNWTWQPLGELFEIGAGKTMSVLARTGENKVPFLRTSNVLWDEIDLRKVDEMAISTKELAIKNLLPGDLLVCEGGDIGRAAVWDGQIPSMSFQNHLHRLRPVEADIDVRFYVYFLQSAFTQLGIFEGAGNKTTIPNLSRNRLAALHIPKPPVTEQRAIAQVLAIVRQAILLQSKTITTTEELKHATMQHLFTRGLRGEAQKKTAIGMVPGSWAVVKIGDIALQVQYGLSMRGQPQGQFPILRMNCQDDGQVIFRDLQYVDIDEDVFLKFRLEEGDLLFNRTNSIEHVGRMAIFENKRDAVFASYLVRLRVNANQCLPRLLNYYMNRPEVQRDIKRLASRAVGQANINASKLRTIDFPLPPTLAEQQEIVTILDTLDQKIALHQQKRAVLQDLFQSLLHQLMTGQLRVTDLDLSALPTK